MEQYDFRLVSDEKNIKKILDNYSPFSLFIRDCGGIRENGIYSPYGLHKVNLNLTQENKLDLHFNKKSIDIYVDADFIFSLETKGGYYNGFSVGYERTDKDGIMFFAPYPHDNPNNDCLPVVKKSVLRNVIDSHLIEISFKEKILLIEDGKEDNFLYFKPQ